MFTGIVQQIGVVENIENLGDAIRIKVMAPKYFSGSKVGESIANDGVCVTIEENTDDYAYFTMINQTLEATAFKNLKLNDHINLEKACKVESFLGGHYVMGHVDGVAKVSNIISRETGKEIELKIPNDFMKYIISKGSITLNGISLTVAEKTSEGVRVAIIPETLEKTNLGAWDIGTLVNFEVDVLGKYVESLVGASISEFIKNKA